MMQRVYRDQLTSSDDITLKYKDEDGDLVRKHFMSALIIDVIVSFY